MAESVKNFKREEPGRVFKHDAVQKIFKIGLRTLIFKHPVQQRYFKETIRNGT